MATLHTKGLNTTNKRTEPIYANVSNENKSVNEIYATINRTKKQTNPKTIYEQIERISSPTYDKNEELPLYEEPTPLVNPQLPTRSYKPHTLARKYPEIQSTQKKTHQQPRDNTPDNTPQRKTSKSSAIYGRISGKGKSQKTVSFGFLDGLADAVKNVVYKKPIYNNPVYDTMRNMNNVVFKQPETKGFRTVNLNKINNILDNNPEIDIALPTQIIEDVEDNNDPIALQRFIEQYKKIMNII